MKTAVILVALALGGLATTQQAVAQAVRIVDIPSADDIEVVAVKDGSYVMVSDLGVIKFPLKAVRQKDGALQFKVGGSAYNISRADVTLSNEKLVNDACKTVPVTLAADARSASVKGAGEACK